MANKDKLREWLASPHPEIESATPIENMMFRALTAMRRKYADFLPPKEMPIFVFQDEFGPYRVDFCIHAKSLVAIECDGHEFHYRTKEQAARDKRRDREITERGAVMLRFTGAEIYANPFECAEQALRVATGIDLRHVP